MACDHYSTILYVVPMLLILLFTILPSNAFGFLYNIPEDAVLNITELSRKYGREMDEHEVITEDEYILKLFNIPGDKNKPVLLVHGFLDSADTFVISGNDSLALTLARTDYDVWIASLRGVKYSRRHLYLNPDYDNEYWDFSFHDMGFYDLPSIIDFILHKNKVEKLKAIGHSLGNTVFYVLCAKRPEYNKRLDVIIALGPISFLNYNKPPFNLIVKFGPVVNEVLKMFNDDEILRENAPYKIAMDDLCSKEVIGYKVCGSVFFDLAGYDTEEFTPDIYYKAIKHFPAGTSRKNALHLLQIARGHRFKHFDYGVDNLEVYGKKIAPNYSLKKVTTRVALYVGLNDNLTPIKNVERLARKLPNVVEFRHMDRLLFNHIDFLWGKNMKDYLFPHIMKTLNDF